MREPSPLSLDLPADLAHLLLTHYDQTQRSFPWRGEKDFYRVWVSEIMLQQTGTATVAGYYSRFLARFPTVADLAGATEEEVLSQWQGLGYYRRAIHLWRGAAKVVERGGFPEDLAGWMALPGVGRSTAAAILAIVRDQPQAILDGNVKRVLSRLVAMALPVSGREGEGRLWQIASFLTPRERPGDYAQAIMDLGAMVCKPRAPACDQCPWGGMCRARALGNPEGFPVVMPRLARPRVVERVAVILSSTGGVLLFKRPAGGLLGGLWESAMIPEEGDLAERLLGDYGVRVEVGEGFSPVHHVFTHFHLTVHPVLCRHQAGIPVSGRHEAWRIATPGDLPPLSTLHRKVLARVLGKGWFLDGKAMTPLSSAVKSITLPPVPS